MPERSDQLTHNFTGYESKSLDVATHRTCAVMARAMGDGKWDHRASNGTIDFVRSIYDRQVKGVFGGAISQGDAVVVAESIRLIKPRTVIEIGVASGFSSLVILSSMERCGLLEGDARLLSFDLLERHHNDSNMVVGQVVGKESPHLAQWWTLNTECTMIDYVDMDPPESAPVLAFVDGGHFHPWPVIDLFVLCRKLPAGSWLLMQDIGLPERLFIDSIRQGSIAGPGWRGAEIAYEHWLGPKFHGLDSCFNMAAVQIPEDPEVVDRSLRSTMIYPFELPLDERADAFVRETMGMADLLFPMKQAFGTGPRPNVEKMRADAQEHHPG